jgi:hypothetical protein
VERKEPLPYGDAAPALAPMVFISKEQNLTKKKTIHDAAPPPAVSFTNILKAKFKKLIDKHSQLRLHQSGQVPYGSGPCSGSDLFSVKDWRNFNFVSLKKVGSPHSRAT